VIKNPEGSSVIQPQVVS